MCRTLLLLPPVLICACGMDALRVEGTGEAVTKVVPVAMLNGITLSGSMDVTVVRGDTQRVEIKAQPELIDLVKTKVDNGMWVITTEKDYRTNKGFEVRLTVPMLNSVIVNGSGSVSSEEVYNTGKTHLEITGSGSIRIDTLRESLVEAWIEGSGGIHIGAGECRRLEARLGGSGELIAPDLCATNMTTVIPGSGSVTVDILDSLTADIRGSGGVRYRGRPVVISRSTGSGSLTALP